MSRGRSSLMLYGVLAIVSAVIRQCCLPNPFTCFGDMAEGLNLIVSIVLVPISYAIVGLFYQKGSDPAAGSVCFLITYALITFGLWVLGLFSFKWWWILIVVVVCVVIVVGIKELGDKLGNEWLD